MLFMVIERFRNADPKPIGERFKTQWSNASRGPHFHASWVDSAGTGCFQVMEAPRPELLNSWVSRWDDLIDFEIVPVLAPTDFWAKAQLSQNDLPPS